MSRPVPPTPKQRGHGVPYKSPHPGQAKKDAEQAARHNADMERVQRMHERGMPKK